jgi:hypothetical protein
VIAHTDHHALAFIAKMLDSTNPRLVRWAADLVSSRIVVHYRPGAQNTVNDALSRAFPAQPIPLSRLLSVDATSLRSSLVAAADLVSSSPSPASSVVSAVSSSSSASAPLQRAPAPFSHLGDAFSAMVGQPSSS